MRHLRPALLATTAVAALVAPPSPAAASDATLKTEVEAILVELRPALGEFTAAAKGLERAQSTARLQEATQGFRDGLSRYKWGVVNRKASSPEGLAAKRQLLTAIRQYDIGLVQYEKGLDKLEAGGSKASILASLRTADRRFDAGVEDEQAALTTLGVAPQA